VNTLVGSGGFRSAARGVPQSFRASRATVANGRSAVVMRALRHIASVGGDLVASDDVVNAARRAPRELSPSGVGVASTSTGTSVSGGGVAAWHHDAAASLRSSLATTGSAIVGSVVAPGKMRADVVAPVAAPPHGELKLGRSFRPMRAMQVCTTIRHATTVPSYRCCARCAALRPVSVKHHAVSARLCAVQGIAAVGIPSDHSRAQTAVPRLRVSGQLTGDTDVHADDASAWPMPLYTPVATAAGADGPRRVGLGRHASGVR
jgi:hypothetical protein